MQGFTIRQATRDDCGIILEFIRDLARYEKLEDQVVATEEGLRRSIFERGQAGVIIGEFEGRPVGFALYFHNYSTFLGKANLYLEDLYVREEYRGKGFGKQLFIRLAAIATEEDCERLDWWCLNWNEPSIAFYKSLGAVAMDEWTVFRLEGGALRALAGQP